MLLLLCLTLCALAQEKVIVVVAPGHQGLAVVRAVREYPGYGCRIVVSSQHPRGDFTTTGCSVVSADMTDASSLAEAFQGVHGVFATLIGGQHEVGEEEVFFRKEHYRRCYKSWS